VAAVAVGELQLKLDASWQGDRSDLPRGRIAYLSPNGDLQTRDFTDSVEITTPKDRISEVAVGFAGERAGDSVVVKINVSSP